MTSSRSENAPSSAPPSSQTGRASEARRKASERLGSWIRGKYRLESLLGVGGMATVYAAQHRNGSRVAVKVMHAELAREETVKRRFLREGYVANKVDHPGVVRILDDDETELGEPFLVMELLDGETLQQLWKRRKRKVHPAEALAIATQVLDVLVPFHEQNIVHRDLKPANIFICPDGTVKLLDFGVAQLREAGEAMTKAGTALGTPSYMSPEQAQGKSAHLDGRSDLFAVGATLFAVLSGRRLHHGKSDNEAFILAATQPAPSLARRAPDLDVELIALVDRALQWDRRKRFADAASMRDACLDVLEKLGATPPPGLSKPSTARAAIPSGPPSPPIAPHSAPPSTPRSPKAGRHASGGQQATSAPPRQSSGRQEAISAPPRRSSGRHAAVSTPARRSSGRHAAISVPPSSGSEAAISTRPPRHSSGRHEAVTEPPAHPSGVEVDEADPEAEAAREKATTERLVDLFQRFERALPTIRQYGLEHPEGRQRLSVIHRLFTEVLAEEPEGLLVEVHPFCLTRHGVTIWEPTPPLDLVPYNLTSASIESFVIEPGLTEDELSKLLASILLDPGRDEDADIAGALWEAQLAHVQFSLREELVDADAIEQIRFFRETEDLEKMAREDLTEAAAMAMSADRSAFDVDRRAGLELEAATRRALEAQLSAATERWLDRHVEVTVEAVIEAATRQDLPTMIDPLRRYAQRLAHSGKHQELAELHDALLEHATEHPQAPPSGVTPRLLTDALFPEPVLQSLIAAAREPKGGEDAAPLGALRGALAYLGDDRAPALLKVADELRRGPLFEVLIDYVEANLPAHRETVVEMLDELDSALAQRMLAALTASGSDRSIAVLRPLLMSHNPALRCEATALLATSQEELGKQLLRLLEMSDTTLRSAALTTMLRHQVRSAGPGLVKLIESEGFAERELSEQEQTFDTLYALNAARAESLLITIVDQHGMLADERLDHTRALAARILGKHADSARPLEALENAARRRPWNTQEVRSAASAAIASIRERVPGHALDTGAET